jgi:hypothetical protein
MGFFDERFAVVTSQSAPHDEKYDAQAELFKTFLGDIKDRLIHPEDIAELQHYLSLPQQAQNASGLQPFQRDVGRADELISKAVQAFPAGVVPVLNRRGGHRSHLYIDELGMISGGHMNHWVEKLSPFGFQALKMMVEHTPVLNAVMITRIRQLNAMSCPFDSQDDHPLGFVCIPKGKKVNDRLTDEEKKIGADLAKFILNCGDEEDPRKRKWLHQRENMTGFIAKLVRDTLTCDACPIETEMTIAGNKISGFYNIPAETVRIAHEDGYFGDDRIVALQIFNDMVISFFTPKDIIYEVRNPRSDITASRYGLAETETFVKVVTGFLNTMTYNMSYFDRNNIPRGIMTIFGNFDEEQINHFKRMWNASLSGPAQRWRLPVFISKGREAASEFTKIDEGVNEMQFAKWMTFLVSIICATYTIAPEEINFDSFTSRSSTPLGGQDQAEKLAQSRDKGLEPLVSWIEQIYNEFLIPLYNPDYVMRYVGLHREDQKNIFELKKLAWTVNEARHALGDEEMKDPDIGEAPLNQSLIAIYQGKMQQQQQEAMGMGPQAQEHGLPQDVLDGLGNEEDEDGGGDQMAGRQDVGEGGQGDEKLRQAEIQKAQRRFVVYADVKQPRDKYDGWTI